MTLTPGTRLGPYEVVAPIGVGGMGEVYRARDTTLNRDVALKVLPDAFAQDADRLARFTREAQTLAALNHPNIAQIYGLEGEAGREGQAGHPVALVMEMVEGEDLSQRIARGAIPLDEALPIAKQIVEALEAAHEQGIIHRDLKPANIKVRPDGTVKVLDFGLAKAMEPTGSASPNLSHSPTITTPAMTQAGMILGTAAYMSPEQARGKTVDRRADIWAFGAVLFEMLTAQRAFPGEDLTDTLAAVVKLEPTWDALGANVPARVRQLLRVCLQKDPRQRVQAIGDVRLALDGAFETTSPQPHAVSSSRRGSLGWAVAAVGVLVAAGLAIPAVGHLRETSPPAPSETRLDITTPTTSDPVSLAVSPDGRKIVFVASADGVPRLWLRSLGSATAQALAGTDAASLPFWSPDSKSVAFFANGQLERLDLGGGAPQTLGAARSSRGGAWSDSGVILFAPGATTGLSRVPASGGTVVSNTSLGPGQTSHRFPFFLPDGRHFLFYAQGSVETSGIYLGSLDEGTTTRLTSAGFAGVYLEPGWLLWVRGTALVARPLDLTRRALAGDPVTLAENVAIDANVNAAAVSVSNTGLVAYRSGGASRRQLRWFDRTGKVLGTIGTPDDSGLLGPSVSPDGRRVVVSRTTQGNQDLWLLDGVRTSRLTFDAGLERYPIWSPDGHRIVFSSNRTGPFNLFEKAANGTGAEVMLVDSPTSKTANDWSRDGRFLLFHSTEASGTADLVVRPMSAAADAPSFDQPSVALRTQFNEKNGQFSADGRWVAYMSDESGRMEVYVRPFTPGLVTGALGSGGGERQVSTVGGVYPTWRADGKELYYLASSGDLMAVPVAARGTTMEPGTPTPLFRTSVYGGGVENSQGRQYDVTRDGRFLINTVLDEASAPITLVQNWRPDSKK